MIREKDGNLLIELKVLPRSKKNSLEITDTEIRLKITAPPVDGEANKMVVDFFAKTLDVIKKNIIIERGENSRHKTLKICGLTRSEFFKLVQPNKS